MRDDMRTVLETKSYGAIVQSDPLENNYLLPGFQLVNLSFVRVHGTAFPDDSISYAAVLGAKSLRGLDTLQVDTCQHARHCFFRGLIDVSCLRLCVNRCCLCRNTATTKSYYLCSRHV